MAEIALSNTSNISLSTVPSGIAEPSVNSIALFTIEKPNTSDEFTAHVGASTVAEIYGTDSVTNKMAEAIFAQSKNLRTGGGTLYVIPYVGTNGKSCVWTSNSLVSKIEAFQKIKDGALKITLDGVQVEKTGMNFESVKTVADIAKVINNAGFDMFVTTNEDAIIFTSKRVGTDSTIEFQTTLEGTDIGTSSYLDGSSGNTQEGANDTAQETLPQAVARMEDKISFGGILTTQVLSNQTISANAQALQMYMNHFYIEGFCSLANIDVLGQQIKADVLFQTHLMAYSLGLVDMKRALAGSMSRALSVNWAGSNTANTMNLKQLATIAPDLNLNQTYFEKAKANGVDLYGSTQGYSCYYSFDNGKYLDELIMDAFLKTKLEVAGFNALAKAGTKVSQTEAGVAVLKDAYREVLIQGVRNGYIAPNKWNSPQNRFGNLEDFDSNVEQFGYYEYSLPVNQQAQADREKREAPLIQIAVKRGGAIHSTNGDVIVER